MRPALGGGVYMVVANVVPCRSRADTARAPAAPRVADQLSSSRVGGAVLSAVPRMGPGDLSAADTAVVARYRVCVWAERARLDGTKLQLEPDCGR